MIQDKIELTSDIRTKKPFVIGTYAILCLVAIGMTVLNIITDKGKLTVWTAVFAGLCFVNIFLTIINEKTVILAKMLFAVEIVFLFSVFLVSGNPEGFSAIWICLLPSAGMFFFGRKSGTYICFAMFLIMVFFLWIPYGNTFLMYQYTETFKMRFPILFVAFHLLAFLLETMRERAYNDMHLMQTRLKELSSFDQLTGMFNRQGMYSELEDSDEYKNTKKITVAMFDIDFFKHVNDTYGHNVGDVVLKEFAYILRENLNATLCRWGGEEFVAISYNDGLTKDKLEIVHSAIKKHTFTISDGNHFNITVSIGFCEKEGNLSNTDIDSVIENADKALYYAKNNGRDQIVSFDVI